jgi:hypothetical protein
MRRERVIYTWKVVMGIDRVGMGWGGSRGGGDLLGVGKIAG